MDFVSVLFHSRLPRQGANEEEDERQGRAARQAAQNRGTVPRAGTAGNKAAAGAREPHPPRLREEVKGEKPAEVRFSLPDPWSRQMFIALCRRYGLRPYRHPRMRRQSVMVRVPQGFPQQSTMPEFQQINAALIEYLAQVTDRVIREAVYRDTGDAEKLAEPEKLGR